ncbi:MAG: hypothetical protein ABR881_24330 [Candidatus Sulfotelmatobacter sp.]|jgi:hypothetical protein
MNLLKIGVLTAIMILVALSTTGCSPSLPKGAVGNAGRYNYSPSVIQIGDTRLFWWCSQGVNPADSSQNTDAIYFESIDMSTLDSYGPVLVLAETPGAWDSAYTCNPKVIGGVFENPLGDGQNYSFAMYYVATAEISGLNNSIGVAFSNDGILWKKYPLPVILSTSQTGYGVGQPALYNSDHKAAISMFYEDSNPTSHHVAAVSTDGLHFTVQGTLTCNGLDPDDPQASWGDMSYDVTTGEWYAVFNRPLRPQSATGGTLERGQYGIELYKIPQSALLTGASPWQQLVTMDTNATGFESNFIAGFVRDHYGNINAASYPTIQMYTSVSYSAPNWDATPAEAGASASPEAWILMPMNWVPDVSAAIPFNRYFNGSVHEVTTGWISPDAGFQLQGSLGHLYANPANGATVPFYGCKGGQKDYFVSLDIGCEGQRILGKDGYGYSQPVSGLNLVALYRCFTGYDHFVSKDPKCEGQKTDELLGYVAP